MVVNVSSWNRNHVITYCWLSNTVCPFWLFIIQKQAQSVQIVKYIVCIWCILLVVIMLVINVIMLIFLYGLSIKSQFTLFSLSEVSCINKKWHSYTYVFKNRKISSIHLKYPLLVALFRGIRHFFIKMLVPC